MNLRAFFVFILVCASFFLPVKADVPGDEIQKPFVGGQAHRGQQVHIIGHLWVAGQQVFESPWGVSDAGEAIDNLLVLDDCIAGPHDAFHLDGQFLLVAQVMIGIARWISRCRGCPPFAAALSRS